MANLSNLPREVEEEILSRVPIKSLRCLRSTGKRWYHHPLFKDPGFIKRLSDRTPRQYHEPIMLHEFSIVSMSSYVDRDVDLSEFVLTDPVTKRKVGITQAFHCDGILLCNTKDKRFVAWNPYSGQTRWIQPGNHQVRSSELFALGYDNKDLFRSYKMLRCLDQTVEIYEFKSDSWRSLDGISPGGSFESLGVSLKGNAYWISRRGGGAKEYSLLEFDFSTERFQNLYLPFHQEGCLGPLALSEGLKSVALSVVKDVRLCLLYESAAKSKTEIWMSSEIETTSASSWSWCKFSRLRTAPRLSSCVSFLIDDEKRFFIDEAKKRTYCFYNHENYLCKVNVVEEDGTVKLMGWYPSSKCGPIVFGYLPKLD